jgi:hypothetical protein
MNWKGEMRQITDLFIRKMHIYGVCRPSYDAIYDMDAHDLDVVRAALWSMLQRFFTRSDIAQIWMCSAATVSAAIDQWTAISSQSAPEAEVVFFQQVLKVFSLFIAAGRSTCPR